MTDNFQLSTLHSQLPKGYKQTEVGVIPEDWACTRLSEFLAFISYGFTNPMPTVPDGVFMITAADINDGCLQLESARKTSDSAYRTLLTAKSKPRQNDILLTKDGTLGRLALVGKETICINQSVAVLRCNDRVAPQFLKLLLESPHYQKRMVEDAGGSTIKHIYITIVDKMEVGLPLDKAEQRAIAAALSDVDALLAKLDQLIAKKRDLKQAAMQQLLTGQTRLVESGEWRVESGENSQLSTFNSQLKRFSGAWEVKSVKSIVETPVTDGPHLTPQFLEDGVPFLSVNNLVDNKINLSELRFISKKDDIEFSKKCKPQKNDLLLGKAASVGKVAIVETDFDFNIWSPIAMIRIGQREHPRFVYYQLQSADLVKQIALLTNSSSQGNIGMGDIEKLLIQLPTYEEQTAIATVLSDMDAELVALEARRDKTRALKQGMMQELLTGRIRLVSGKLRGES